MASSVIGALRVNLGIDSAAFSNGLKAAQGRMAKFAQAAKVGLAAAAAVAGATALAIKGTIDEADEMAKAASKFGVPIDELSRLKYAGDLAGVSFEGLGTSIARMSRLMNDAKNGQKEAVATFDQLGISVTNADGTLKGAADVLAEVSDRFAAMPDGAEKTALAMDLMGRSGANMIPLLNGGADALRAAMKEADTFGKVFTQAMGADAERFNDNISRLQGALGNLVADLTRAVLPALAAMSDFAVKVAAGFETLDPAIQSFIATGGALTAGLTALAIPLGAVAIAIAAIGAPIALTVAGIAALTAAVIAFQPQIMAVDKAIMDWARNFDAWVIETFNRAVEKVKAFGTAIVAMKDAAIAAVSEMVTQVTTWLTTKFNAAWDAVAGKVDAVAEKFRWLYDKVVGHSWIPDMVIEIGQWMARLDGNMVQPAARAADGVSDAFRSAGGDAEGFFEGIGSSLAGLIDRTKTWKHVLADVMRSLARSVGSNVSFGGGAFGGLVKGIFKGLTGFSRGGSILPGGAGGGIDSQVVAFRKSPGEQVDIYDPKRQSRGGGTMHPVINQTFAITGAVSSDDVVRMVIAGKDRALAEMRAALPTMQASRQSFGR